MSLASMLNPVDDGQDDQGRDIKRRRVDSVPARSLHHATHDLPSARSAWSPTAFEQPQHLSSFSYSPARELLLPSSGRADEALRIYAEPPLGANLNRGIAEAVMRKEGVAEGLDSLLACLMDTSSTLDLDSIFLRASIVTWRGMATKLCKSVFSTRADDGWEMNAMMVDGVLYLEDSISDAQQAARGIMSDDQRRSTYYGYAFESYCTKAEGEERPADGWTGDVNTAVQWCSVVKTKLGSLRLILGGEVDALLEPPGDLIEPKNFVELKTNMQITSIGQEISFEKFKLLTSYLQAFLLGVATVIIGFRTRQGIVTGLQRFSTLDIPRLVRGKPHAWDPAAALGGAHQLGAFIRDSIISSPSQQLVDESFRSAVTDVDLTSERWPVFRVRYDGAARRVEVLELAEEEYEVMLTGADRQQRDRIGFLIREWVLEGWKRRRRVDPDYKLNVQAVPFPRNGLKR